MSDEEEIVPKQKRLTKKGRHTLADSSSDEDEDLFGSDNDDESQSEVVDALYSKESLKSAMVSRIYALICSSISVQRDS
jgi:hypothetical protein